MIDEQQIRKLVHQELENREQVNSYSVSLIPYHSHTGVDSPQVNAKNLTGVIVPRVISTTSSGSATPNADITDLFELTAQTATAAFQPPSGAIRNGQFLKLRVTSSSTGTPIPLTFSSATGGYIANSPSLPSSTVTGKTSCLGFEYDTSNSVNKWRLIYSANS